MDTFGKYIQGYGDIKFTSTQAREIVMSEMIKQGLNQVYSAPLPSMTFRLFERRDEDNPEKTIYFVAWQGR